MFYFIFQFQMQFILFTLLEFLLKSIMLSKRLLKGSNEMQSQLKPFGDSSTVIIYQSALSNHKHIHFQSCSRTHGS